MSTSGRGAPPSDRVVEASALTRHAVCVGMTGSGKTGLCIGLLEDLAGAGVPILAIDPKGDLANLALVFPDLRPEELAPWVGDQDPRAVGDAWLAGWAAAGRSPSDVRRWTERTDVRVLTPGSTAGTPVDVLGALTRAPPALRGDEEGLREYVVGAVGSLLGLVGVDANPLTDPPAILLAKVLGEAFSAGRDMPVEVLIPALVDPPFTHVGVFDVDAFMPREARLRLAGRLNAVVSSPAFAGWKEGVPLDVGAWLQPVHGASPVTVLVLSHLDDDQRQFFVSLVLHAVVAWSRRLPGATSLRALLYFDEVMGYLPPHPKNPPTKGPVLTLMKQARAVGVGVMLVTQNPVDLDYKALSNAGTWIVGRLQTRQDRERVRDGLERATGADRALDDQLAALPRRAFLVRDEHGTREVRSRHTYSLLRGPLSRAEIGQLPGARRVRPAPAAAVGHTLPPPLPEGLSPRFLHPDGLTTLSAAPPAWQPAVYARWQARFEDGDFAEERTLHRLLRPGRPLDEPPEDVALLDAWLLRQRPPTDAPFAPLTPGLSDARAVRSLAQAWTDEVSMSAQVDGPDGPVYASKTRLLGVLVVWVPPG